MNDKVIVTSMVNGMVSINVPHLRVSKSWPKKGTKLPLPMDFLREAIYDPGVEYLFKKGILYIDDMECKIELGLEEEGTKVPTLIPLMDEKYMTRLLTVMPLAEMKMELKKMNEVQKNELIEFASSRNNINIDRLTAMDEAFGTDMLGVVKFRNQKED